MRVEVHHPSTGQLSRGVAVLDTGASMSAIDREVARDLALPSPGYAQWFAVSDTGTQPASPLRTAQVVLAGDRRHWEIKFIEVPALAASLEGYTLMALLGWDFLRWCKLTCDGPNQVFDLELPLRRASGRRRR